MSGEVVNRIAKSDLVSITLDDYYPEGERVLFDMKTVLKQDILLIEKDLRTFVQENDWSVYTDKYVGITCSVDAIIPLWAYMLVASAMNKFAKKVVLGGTEVLEKEIFNTVFSFIDFTTFKNKNIVLAGCGKRNIPPAVVLDFELRLERFAKKIMYGEACSSVPLFKKK